MKWGEFEVEAHLGGTALVVTSLDRPGVIGFIGTTLGNASVNIARVHLGVAGNGRAISVWNLDGDVPAASLDEVRRSPNVQAALAIRI